LKAKAAVWRRATPAGVRGVSVAQRSNRYGTVKDYQQLINDNIAVMVQIETPASVEVAEAIASVAGVDGLFVGPQDLSASSGHIGQPSHPEVQALIARVFASAKAAGKPSGILAPVEADARRYMEMGASFVAVGSDLGALRSATQALRNMYL
jgi:2-dehydro-3-deoxyglucarate aldolase